MTFAGSRGERESRRRDVTASLAQLPWKQPRRRFAPARVLSDDQIETIHRPRSVVLEEIGMDMLHAEAREILADAGRASAASACGSAATSSSMR